MKLRHNPDQRRYELEAEDSVAVLEYEEAEGVRVFTHTFVPEALRGKSLAGKLTRFALDDTRAAGKQVRPQCSYTQTFLRRHPEYADMQAEGEVAPACGLRV